MGPVQIGKATQRQLELDAKRIEAVRHSPRVTANPNRCFALDTRQDR